MEQNTARKFAGMSYRFHKHAMFVGLWVLVSVSTPAQDASISCVNCAEWNQPQTPFRIFGNTYYVGTHALTSLLITSSAGHILIDGDLPQSVSQITANIRTLGFRIKDVKLIVNSHAHFDHAGGIAELQRLSGARVAASPWSAEVFRKGGVGKGDPQHGTIPGIASVRNVSTLHDGENFHVGTTTITAHLTPGHTPGGTSWTWKSCEGPKCYQVVYADSLTPISGPEFRFTASQEYPNALADFEKSFTFLETTPCDVLLTPHPEVSDLWDRMAARKKGTTPDPLADSGACRQLAENAREKLRERLASENKSSAQ
jgi:metallo-beta-lactamase class B